MRPKTREMLGILALCAALAIAAPARAQKVELGKLVADTQKISQTGQRIVMVWWLPNEYWEAVVDNDPSFTKEMARNIIRVVGDYFIVALVDGRISPFGSITARPRPELLAELSLTVPGNRELRPLEDGKLPPDLQNLIVALKPMFAKMAGQFGQAMEMFVFPGVTPGGARFVDPRREGRFSLGVAGQSFQWRLPLGSLLPDRYDPDTKETFPGNFNFNPFTGNKLRARD